MNDIEEKILELEAESAVMRQLVSLLYEIQFKKNNDPVGSFDNFAKLISEALSKVEISGADQTTADNAVDRVARISEEFFALVRNRLDE